MTAPQNTIKNFKLFHLINEFRIIHPIFFSITLILWSIIVLFFTIKSIYPPKDLITKYNLEKIKEEITLKKQFINNKTKNLNNFPFSKNKLKYLIDGWGNKIQLKLINPDKIELISFGKDGIPGKEPDINIVFNINS